METACNRTQDELIVKNMKENQAFAQNFIYGNSTAPGKSIAGIRSSIIKETRKKFHVDLNANTFNTILYEHLWSEGTWKTLDSFNYKSSFFHWLRIIAAHCTIAFLIDEGYIKPSSARTPGNTRLKWKSKTPEYCKEVLDDMINIEKMHSFLSAVYVDRLDKGEIMKKFEFDEEMYKLTLKASEKTLKTALLTTENNYADFISDKKSNKVTVSSELMALIGNTCAEENDYSPLRDVLGISPEDPEFEVKVTDFLYEFSNNLGWSEEDKTLWQGRFIKNIAPVEMAEILGRSRAYIDTRFSRLQCRFKKAIREWWSTVAR